MVELSSFHIEEYKHAQERINALESRREQMILLNTTAFAAIIGFSKSLSDTLVPYLVLGVLLLSAFAHAQYTILQNMVTAFVLERYEKAVNGLVFERGYVRIMFESSKRPISRLIWLLGEPYLWFILISISVSLIFGSRFWCQVNQLYPYVLFFYSGFLVLGHLAVLFSFYLRRLFDIEYFQLKWRDALDVFRE